MLYWTSTPLLYILVLRYGQCIYHSFLISLQQYCWWVYLLYADWQQIFLSFSAHCTHHMRFLSYMVLHRVQRNLFCESPKSLNQLPTVHFYLPHPHICNVQDFRTLHLLSSPYLSFSSVNISLQTPTNK